MTRRARGVMAACQLAIFVAGLVGVPWLHARHHAGHGDDHVHYGAGADYAPARHAHDGAHAAYDEALLALELAEVAAAGVPAVDCALAAFTLVDCSASTSEHPIAFGDELFAPSSPHDTHDTRRDHGAGAPEHGAATLLAATPTIPLQAPLLTQRLALVTRHQSLLSAARPIAAARGPPTLAPPISL